MAYGQQGASGSSCSEVRQVVSRGKVGAAGEGAASQNRSRGLLSAEAVTCVVLFCWDPAFRKCMCGGGGKLFLRSLPTVEGFFILNHRLSSRGVVQLLGKDFCEQLSKKTLL